MSTNAALQRYLEEVRTTITPPKVGRRVVYTVLFGGSDSLKQPRRPQPGWDFVCVTDRPDLRFGRWKPVIIPRLHRDARRTARIFKIMPWLLFPDADKSIFIDASIHITSSLDEFCDRHCQGADLACFAHLTRDCTYVEALACIEQSKDDPSTIEAQMAAYRRAGFPLRSGLVASAVLFRQHHSEAVRRVMDCWLAEIEEHSARDQLSFNFAVWQTGGRYHPIEMDIFDNPFFEVQPHARFQRFDESGRDVATARDRMRHWLLIAKRWGRLHERRVRRGIQRVSRRQGPWKTN